MLVLISNWDNCNHISYLVRYVYSWILLLFGLFRLNYRVRNYLLHFLMEGDSKVVSSSYEPEVRKDTSCHFRSIGHGSSRRCTVSTREHRLSKPSGGAWAHFRPKGSKSGLLEASNRNDLA